MKRIKLIGFRGIGFSKTQDEDALIRAGHVGWQLEGDKRIFGFHPTEEAIEAAGGIDTAIELLKEGGLLDGSVQVDTHIFERAAELVPILEAQGKKRIPIVWQQIIEVSDEAFGHIQTQTKSWYDDGTLRKYGFPNPSSDVEFDNCATFPVVIGLPIPEPTGQLSRYIPKLEEVGELWKDDENDDTIS